MDFQHAHDDYTIDAVIVVLDYSALHMGKFYLNQAKVEDRDSCFVFFWHEYEKNGIFSQWYRSPFVIEGIRYETAEQYMMAKKVLLARNLPHYERIMQEPDPRTCKKCGKAVRGLDVNAWDRCKEDVVYHANMAKFTQNEAAYDQLMQTGTKIIRGSKPH